MKTYPIKRILAWAGIVLAAVVLIWAAHLTWHTVRLVQIARGAQAALQGDGQKLEAQDAVALVHQANGHLQAVNTDLRPLFPVFKSLKFIPKVGPLLEQMDPLLSYGTALSAAGDLVLQGMEPALTQLSSDDPAKGSLLETLTAALKGGTEQFKAANAYIEQAVTARKRVDPAVLPESVRPLFAKLDDNFPLIQSGVRLLPVLPELLGADGPQNYLVLAQNRDEMRATGGFISGLGNIILDNGKISQFDIGDSYRIDDYTLAYPLPPEPLQRFMLAGIWVARDANWSPDFPEAAQEVQKLYKIPTKTDTQAVVAFDQLFVKGILKALGPIKLPNFTDPVTADNVENYMQQAWAPEPGEGLTPEWWANRKSFMGTMGKVLMDTLFQTRDPGKLLDLTREMIQALEQGHLLVYFNNPQAEQVLAEAGWDGGLHKGSGDFLMLVDSNLGFNKTDTVVNRSLEYHVDLSDPSHPQADIFTQYQHTIQAKVACIHQANYGKTGTYADMQRRCYWDYWRIYLPDGAALVSANVKPVPGDELLSKNPWPGKVEVYPAEQDSQVFAGMMVLPPSSKEQNHLRIDLPAAVVKQVNGTWQYSLVVQKQAGLAQLPFKIVITLPEGSTPQFDLTGWKEAGSNTWEWSGKLTQAQTLSVSWTK